MAEDNQMLLYAAAYETLDAALADMDAVEQLHKDKMIGTFDACRDRSGGRQAPHRQADGSSAPAGHPGVVRGGMLPWRSSMRRLGHHC